MNSEVERIRKINATKAHGHSDSAVSHCAFLLGHITELNAQYQELVDSLCSKSWAGRNRHASVVALAKRLHDSQRTLRPLELEDVALAAGYCIRNSGHDGPCNGLPRNDCFKSI
jgi:hypothetical protein